MIKINVSSLPLKDVIADIAAEFKTEFTENKGEYGLTIPSHIGSGIIKGITFEKGLGLIIYDCTFKEDIEIHYISKAKHPLKFLYILKGKIVHTFEASSEYHKVEQYQNAIVSSSIESGHVVSFFADTPTILNSVEMVVETFTQKPGFNLSEAEPGIKELFVDLKVEDEFYHKGFFSLKTADLFTEMKEFQGSDVVKIIFLEGLTYQVLSQQLLEYLDDKENENNRNVLRKSEIKQIKKAADYICENIGETITVDAVALEVGLNINKLQQGFKILYGDTVNTYVQKKRFTLAKDLMLNTDFNISEIINRIGLSSKSYFSKIFKEEYGLSPSDFRKKNRNVSSNL